MRLPISHRRARTPVGRARYSPTACQRRRQIHQRDFCSFVRESNPPRPLAIETELPTRGSYEKMCSDTAHEARPSPRSERRTAQIGATRPARRGRFKSAGHSGLSPAQCAFPSALTRASPADTTPPPFGSLYTRLRDYPALRQRSLHVDPLPASLWTSGHHPLDSRVDRITMVSCQFRATSLAHQFERHRARSLTPPARELQRCSLPNDDNLSTTVPSRAGAIPLTPRSIHNSAGIIELHQHLRRASQLTRAHQRPAKLLVFPSEASTAFGSHVLPSSRSASFRFRRRDLGPVVRRKQRRVLRLISPRSDKTGARSRVAQHDGTRLSVAATPLRRHQISGTLAVRSRSVRWGFYARCLAGKPVNQPTPAPHAGPLRFSDTARLLQARARPPEEHSEDQYPRLKARHTPSQSCTLPAPRGAHLP